jgi:hypothetical protein
MKPQTLSKGITTILCLLLVGLTQAQSSLKSESLKTDELVVVGSSGLNNSTNEIDMTAEIIDYEEGSVLENGFVYSTTNNIPTIFDTKIIIENRNVTFNSQIKNLLNNTIYYVRPYATSANGIYYGNLSTIDTSTLSNIKIDLKARIKTYPNPSTSYISLSGLMETKNYIIYNMTGKELAKGNVSFNNKIDVRFLNNGLYLLKLDDYEIIKFIKE